MDDDLVRRWRLGDPIAAIAVRNGVRGIAERVLGHPALRGAVGPASAERLRDDARRREVTAAIAREVMQRPSDTASQITALTLLVAGRHAVEAMQEGRPAGTSSHLPPQVAVTFALSPHALSPQVREATERHTRDCGACGEDLRIVRSAVRSLGAVDERAAPNRVADEVARAGPPPSEDLAELMAAAARAGPSKAEAPSTSASRRRPARRPERPAPGAGSPPLGLWRLAAVFLLAAVAIALAAWWSRRSPEDGEGPVDGVAGLADRTPPRFQAIDDLPPAAQLALADIAAGDCRTAGGRLRSVRQEKAEEPRLYLLEGAAFVCAGDGRRASDAFQALDEARARDPRLVVPRQADWYRAQASLLEGDAAGAERSLRQAQLFDERHREDAAAQLARIAELRGR